MISVVILVYLQSSGLMLS